MIQTEVPVASKVENVCFNLSRVAWRSRNSAGFGHPRSRLAVPVLTKAAMGRIFKRDRRVFEDLKRATVVCIT